MISGPNSCPVFMPTRHLWPPAFRRRPCSSYGPREARGVEEGKLWVLPLESLWGRGRRVETNLEPVGCVRPAGSLLGVLRYTHGSVVSSWTVLDLHSPHTRHLQILYMPAIAPCYLNVSEESISPLSPSPPGDQALCPSTTWLQCRLLMDCNAGC